MKIKTIIFDIYDTLLKVQKQTPDESEKMWGNLYKEFFNTAPPVSYQIFCEKCELLIRQYHNQYKLLGIKYPEILWEEILKTALPELTALENERFYEFFYRQSQLWHSVSMSDDTAQFIKFLLNKNIKCGIASNCQQYTLKELDAELQRHNIPSDPFDNELTFLSFKYGFSKPDPYVFQILTIRANSKGIKPDQILMIGDNPENDIEPAKLFGWNTWLLTNEKSLYSKDSGLWTDLLQKFF